MTDFFPSLVFYSLIERVAIDCRRWILVSVYTLLTSPTLNFLPFLGCGRVTKFFACVLNLLAIFCVGVCAKIIFNERM